MGATSKEKKLKGPPATLDGDLGRQPCTGLPIFVLVGPPRSHLSSSWLRDSSGRRGSSRAYRLMVVHGGMPPTQIGHNLVGNGTLGTVV